MRLKRGEQGYFLPKTSPMRRIWAPTPRSFSSRRSYPRSLLMEMPPVTVDDQAAGRLRNGMQVNLPEFSGASLVKVFTGPTELLGIAKRIAGTLMQPIVVLG